MVAHGFAHLRVAGNEVGDDVAVLLRAGDVIQAERLIGEARPVYYFNAALHSDETGSTESVLELAYRLAVSEQPMIRRMRSNLVVLINPVSNPDGRDKQVEIHEAARFPSLQFPLRDLQFHNVRTMNA